MRPPYSVQNLQYPQHMVQNIQTINRLPKKVKTLTRDLTAGLVVIKFRTTAMFLLLSVKKGKSNVHPVVGHTGPKAE
jgi:hypothetical protein